MGGSSSSLAPLTAMERSMDVSKFMGSWYVIANIPTPFEKNAFNAMETYAPAKEGSKYDIDINFTFSKGSFAAERKEMPQKAWLHNKTTNAEWRISPIVGPITIPYKAPYIICDVGPEESSSSASSGNTGSALSVYSTTMIGYPDRSYLWLMARKPVLSTQEYDALLAKAAERGYDMSKVQKVPQQPLEDRPPMAQPAVGKQDL